MQKVYVVLISLLLCSNVFADGSLLAKIPPEALALLRETIRQEIKKELQQEVSLSPAPAAKCVVIVRRDSAIKELDCNQLTLLLEGRGEKEWKVAIAHGIGKCCNNTNITVCKFNTTVFKAVAEGKVNIGLLPQLNSSQLDFINKTPNLRIIEVSTKTSA